MFGADRQASSPALSLPHRNFQCAADLGGYKAPLGSHTLALVDPFPAVLHLDRVHKVVPCKSKRTRHACACWSWPASTPGEGVNCIYAAGC